MFGLFKKQTREDPIFGALVKRRASWIGSLRTPLFPDIDVAIFINAQDENAFAALRRHLEQVIGHCGAIRSEIASEALETYRMYQDAERDTQFYEDITSQDAIWPLIKPLKWHFELGNRDYKSRVIIDFGWPNDHYLVAHLADAELYHLDVQG